MSDHTEAVAILQDGSRIPISDPLDEARRLWRDGQYSDEVRGIEGVSVSHDTQAVAMTSEWPVATVQLALI